MKLLFVSPIVSRRYTTDWLGVNRGLAATLASLARQTNPDWKLMVVGGDQPCLPARLMEHVIFVAAHLDIDDPASKGRREVDKERKQYCAYVQLHQYAPDYVMPLDYDDLVSTRLVEFVANHGSYDAFLLKSGYIYRDGDAFAQYSANIFGRTGSTVIVRYRRDLFPTEASDFSPPPKGYRDWPFVSSHIKRPRELFESLGLRWKTLPFPAVVWRRNAMSISNAYNTDSSAPATRRESYWKALVRSSLERIKKRVTVRPIDARFCEEFGCEVDTGLGLSTALRDE